MSDFDETMNAMQLACQQFALIAAHVEDVDVEKVRKTVAMADAAGFVVDPTRYHAALNSGSLDRQKHLVDLFTKTKAELKKLFPQGWPA